ncbi:MAG: class I SAM-dependent methyltransferase [Alphaproteobacteria bacterium]|nr:class I SAM-dependent methyltransferase [Alphaproteobacteria bacterium]
MIDKASRRLRAFYRTHLRYRLWRLRNWRRPYSDYYVDVVMGKLNAGLQHPAIGSDVVAHSTPMEMFDFLAPLGLRRDHCVVDYGCGSLRLGRPFIEYLDAGKYWGYEVTPEFLRIGRDKLPAGLLEAKRPNLRVIDERTLAEGRAANPDFIACWKVVSKVPEHLLDEFFRNLTGLLRPGGRILLEFSESDHRVKVSPMSWANPRALLLDHLERAMPGLEIRIHRLSGGAPPVIQKSVMEIALGAERPGKAAGSERALAEVDA